MADHTRHGGNMRIRTITITAAIAAAVTLTGCSSGSSNDDTAPSTTAPAATKAAADDGGKAALEDAVKAYTALLFKGDPAGYDYLSARCKQQMTHDAWNDLATQGHHDYGSQQATGIKIDQLSGDLARVSYGAGNIPQFNRTAQPWTREGGSWRWDAC